jgi:hypothetical protein
MEVKSAEWSEPPQARRFSFDDHHLGHPSLVWPQLQLVTLSSASSFVSTFLVFISMASSDIAVGAHCSLERCNVNDFLPIKCHCERVFCKDHISPESHSCPLLESSFTAQPARSAQKLNRCAAEKCNKPSLEAFIANSSDTEGRTPALCPQCHQAFCARYAVQLHMDMCTI